MLNSNKSQRKVMLLFEAGHLFKGFFFAVLLKSSMLFVYFGYRCAIAKVLNTAWIVDVFLGYDAV
jgi:hypothetical protein